MSVTSPPHRAYAALFALVVPLVLVGASGCSKSDDGFGVRLALHFADAVDDAALATVTKIDFVDNEGASYAVATPGGAHRDERLVYRPTDGTQQLALDIAARAASGDVVASGHSGRLTLVAGGAIDARVELTAGVTVLDAGLDGGEDLADGAIGDAAVPRDATTVVDASFDHCSLSGVIAGWRMDEAVGATVHDCRSVNDGTIVGDVAWVDDGGPALAFTGGYVSLPSDAALRLANAFTISFWVKASASLNASPGDVITRFSSNANWAVNVTSGPNVTGVVFHADGTQTSASAAFGADTWVHVAIVFTPLGSLTVWVNGAKAGSVAVSKAVPIDATSPRIGRNQFDVSVFTGRLRRLLLFGRALGDAEIQALAN